MYLAILVTTLLSVTHGQLCTADELYATVCQPEASCAFLYRVDGAAGIQKALDYYASYNARFGAVQPVWPVSWTAAGLTTWTQIASCPYALAGEKVTYIRDALERFALFIASDTQTCNDPNEDMIYSPLTGQYRCRCQEGHTCADSLLGAMGTGGSNYGLLIAAGVLLLLMVLAALIISITVPCCSTRRMLLIEMTYAPVSPPPAGTSNTLELREL
jgi:hypothetical protein